MQRLEVSVAVRPIYGSLGVKGLMNLLLTNYYQMICYIFLPLSKGFTAALFSKPKRPRKIRLSPKLTA